jgi:hypothetical protein
MTIRIVQVTTLVLTAVLITGITKATAGVVVDFNGEFPVWTNDNDGTTYYFYSGAYNLAAVQPEGFASAGNIGEALRDDLNQYDPTALSNANRIFIIASDGNPPRPTQTGINTNIVLFNDFTGSWESQPVLGIDPNTQQEAGASYYWASTTEPASNVPEPSTAIAVGLLGVVGFAGNRRRRQVSAA